MMKRKLREEKVQVNETCIVSMMDWHFVGGIRNASVRILVSFLAAQVLGKRGDVSTVALISGSWTILFKSCHRFIHFWMFYWSHLSATSPTRTFLLPRPGPVDLLDQQGSCSIGDLFLQLYMTFSRTATSNRQNMDHLINTNQYETIASEKFALIFRYSNWAQGIKINLTSESTNDRTKEFSSPAKHKQAGQKSSQQGII